MKAFPGVVVAALVSSGIWIGELPAQTFTRVETGPVVTTPGDTLGGVWEDFDGDGDLDLAVSRLSPRSSLYRNVGGGVFEEVPATADFTPFTTDSNAMAWCDYDNDGDHDLFVLTAARDMLFERTATGFAQVNWFAGESGFRIPITANCVDYDNDGLLDLFVATGGGGTDAVDTLYRNRGGGVFEVIRAGAVVTKRGASGGSSFGDFDGDGWLDLMVPNGWSGGNFLYRNDRAGGFTEVLSGVVVEDRMASDGSAWADYDNDGDLDLFISNGANQNNALYRNDGGTLVRVADGPVVSQMGYSVGAAWGDFDNDGRLDLAVANRLGPCFLYRQDADGGFVVASNVVSATYADANSVSWADYDDDGFLDLFVGNWRGEGGPDLDFLFRNDGNTNSWLRVRLEGRYSNRSGIGAKVRALARIRDGELRQLRQVGGEDSAGAGPLEAHFGLADAAVVDELRVEWPSGIVQVLTNVSARQRLRVTEPEVTNPVVRAEPPGGVFTNQVQVTLSTEPAIQIRYTLETAGSTSTTNVYTTPLLLREATTVRAQAFLGRTPVGDPFTATYLRQYAYEGDGIPDAWRRQWFGSDYSPMDPRVDSMADPDNDGASNLLEYAAQTNPLDAASVLRVRVRLVPQILWEGVPGVTYQVRRRDATTGEGWTNIGGALPGIDGVMNVIDATVPDPYGIYVVEPVQ